METPRRTAGQDLGRDLVVSAGLLLIALFCRAGFVRSHPTVPISDFAALVAFGEQLRDHGFAAPGRLWSIFNSGLPMILAALFRVIPGDPASTARLATAAWTATLPLYPFLLWRGVVAPGVRFGAALLLALWPGQICFSGVVAQDNWVLVPTVALACLAARRLLDPSGRTHAVAAGLLYAFAVAIRQEMLFVLAPLVLAASLSRRSARGGDLLRLLLAAGVPLLLLAAQRWRATGRFALTTEHAGLALLGSFVPGAFDAGWIAPRVWLAGTHPELLADTRRLHAEAASLALAEARRRPLFHAARIGAETARLALRGDASNLFWSVSGPGTQPAARRAAGEAFARNWGPALGVELALIQGAFLVAVAVGFLRRNRAVLVVALAVLLKVGLHAVASPMSRLLLPATALELLAIALAATEWGSLSRPARDGAVLAPFAVAFALNAAVPRLEQAVNARDRQIPASHRFPLRSREGGAAIWCDLFPGRLRLLDEAHARIGLRDDDPAPGDRARVACGVPPLELASGVVFRFEDPYAAGSLPGRIVERVEIEGREVLRHDVAAEPFAGWIEVPVGDGGGVSSRLVVFEILAVAPDRGWSWGNATAASFEFVPSARPRGAEIRRFPVAP